MMRWFTRAITPCPTTILLCVAAKDDERSDAVRARGLGSIGGVGVNGDFSFFLDSEHPLQVMNAVAALLVLDDGRYILQLRDNKPQIFYPDHWGLFGGAVDEGEHEVEALQRELREELGFAPGR